jgi:hypothetical protein
MRNRLQKVLSAAALMMTAATAWADGGLSLREDPLYWPRFQGRLSLGTTTSLSSQGLRPDPLRSQPGDVKLGSLSLMGDYYLTGPLVGGHRLAGGLRATSGLVIGPRNALLSNPALPSPQASPFALSRLAGGVPASTIDGGSSELGTAPYLGIGYTGVSVKGAFSFSADVGLAGPGLRFGRTPSSSQSVDDVLRDLRLTPVIQLGVSYSF